VFNLQFLYLAGSLESAVASCQSAVCSYQLVAL